MTTNHGGLIAAMMTIAVLTGIVAAVLAAFLTWFSTKKTPTAIMAGGTAFVTVAGLMVQVFTSVGPLNPGFRSSWSHVITNVGGELGKCRSGREVACVYTSPAGL